MNAVLVPLTILFWIYVGALCLGVIVMAAIVVAELVKHYREGKKRD